MTVQEIVQQFQTEFDLTLSEIEAKPFEVYKTYLLKGAIASTQRWIAKKAQGVSPIVVNRSATLSSVLRTCQYRAANAKPKAVPIAVRAEELRSMFQDTCTSDNAWTITSQEAEEAIKRYGLDKVKKVLTNVGRYSEDQQSECLDRLEWVLSQESNFVAPVEAI